MVVPTTSYWFTVSTAALLSGVAGQSVMWAPSSRLTLWYLVRNLERWVWPRFEADTPAGLQAAALLPKL